MPGLVLSTFHCVSQESRDSCAHFTSEKAEAPEVKSVPRAI